jgi:fructosamine-3-kinase
LQLTLALDFLPALRARAELVITKPQLRDFFLAALAERQSWFDGLNAACLVHEDLHAFNLLFHHSANGWQLSTILDFDKAWAGSSESDLAKLEFWRGMVHPQFWEAYKRIATIQEGYQQRKALYQLLWCLEYAEPTELHLNDTQTVCRLLGIPAIQNF